MAIDVHRHRCLRERTSLRGENDPRQGAPRKEDGFEKQLLAVSELDLLREGEDPIGIDGDLHASDREAGDETTPVR